MSNTLAKILDELLNKSGLTVTFDPDRNITICWSCKSKNPLAWTARAPGFKERDCRRLCPSCVDTQ